MINAVMKLIGEITQLDRDWEKSKFLPIRGLPAKKKGKFGEDMYKLYLKNKGIKAYPKKSTSYDIKTKDDCIEVKLATRTNRDKRGNYSLTFFQIRQKQKYDKIVFVCIYPDRIDIRQISKKDFMEFVIKHPKQIVWAGGKEKKASCGGDIRKNDLFHFIIPNDIWGKKFNLLLSLKEKCDII